MAGLPVRNPFMVAVNVSTFRHYERLAYLTLLDSL